MPAPFVQFTKRTDFPKLGFIIDQLNRHGIPCRLNGHSAHAPILEVSEQFEDDAWTILNAPARDYGINMDCDLDEVEDDHPVFDAFAYEGEEDMDHEDEDDESSEEDAYYEELNRGYAQDRI